MRGISDDVACTLSFMDEHVQLLGPCVVGRGNLRKAEIGRVDGWIDSPQEHVTVRLKLLVDLIRARKTLG